MTLLTEEEINIQQGKEQSDQGKKKRKHNEFSDGHWVKDDLVVLKCQVTGGEEEFMYKVVNKKSVSVTSDAQVKIQLFVPKSSPKDDSGKMYYQMTALGKAAITCTKDYTKKKLYFFLIMLLLFNVWWRWIDFSCKNLFQL